MIFLDTSFLYPLLSEEDVDHPRVREVFESYRGQRLKDLFITTNLVVGETVTLMRTTPPRNHAAAVKAGEYLSGERIARVHHVTSPSTPTSPTASSRALVRDPGRIGV